MEKPVSASHAVPDLLFSRDFGLSPVAIGRWSRDDLDEAR